MADNLEHAYSAGKWAREAGRSDATCPMYAMGERGNPWRQAWMRGWNDADSASSKRFHGDVKELKGKSTPIRKGRKK